MLSDAKALIKRRIRAGARTWDRVRPAALSHPVRADARTPVRILTASLTDVLEALEQEGIQAWSFGRETDNASKVGVHAADRERVSSALRRLGELGYWVRIKKRYFDREFPLASADAASLCSEDVLAIFKPRKLNDVPWIIRAQFGCELEFWATEELDGAEYLVAPRENAASKQLPLSEFALVPAQWHGMTVQTPAVFAQRMVDDVVFPIDVVYTWVDGSDPRWREKRARAEADERGVEYHPEATTASRFADHEELRYSLRSLEYFAPWVRKIYLVTDDQVPAWLDVNNPKIQVVDHRDIFTDPANLPTFNSNAIISSLHHIAGLSEHYIFMNDDFFIGRWITPDRFFTPFGHARVSPANNRRPFGSPRIEEGPHFNLSRNIRALLQERFGVTVSRAIKHTPYPQLRSVHQRMEEEFAAAYAETTSHRFRHHDDIVADQLFHYYAQMTGSAVRASLRYNYFNIQDSADIRRLDLLQRARDRDVFCLNDAPGEGLVPIEDAVIDRFLKSYFPVPSSFEK
ncbi:MAG: stealth family protein [Tessaracoccus sp.]|uniref:stealth family protein n=1 Tax=Tessaracoccus sp. TaxID=1971211 RepID=UPI001ED6166C|nr:stealth family protein [Tessaracoccus sp.]MBK7820155.1 stealth family protein [Tessaracoccus sp.]